MFIDQLRKLSNAEVGQEVDIETWLKEHVDKPSEHIANIVCRTVAELRANAQTVAPTARRVEVYSMDSDGGGSRKAWQLIECYCREVLFLSTSEIQDERSGSFGVPFTIYHLWVSW